MLRQVFESVKGHEAGRGAVASGGSERGGSCSPASWGATPSGSAARWRASAPSPALLAGGLSRLLAEARPDHLGGLLGLLLRHLLQRLRVIVPAQLAAFPPCRVGADHVKGGVDLETDVHALERALEGLAARVLYLGGCTFDAPAPLPRSGLGPRWGRAHGHQHGAPLVDHAQVAKGPVVEARENGIPPDRAQDLPQPARAREGGPAM